MSQIRPIEDLFTDLIGLKDPVECQAYLNNVCGEDKALRGQLEKLLAAHNDAGSFLQDDNSVEATADVEHDSRLVGSTIGPYKLRELIGEGGMGTVYVAEQDKPLRRKVALKVIKPGMDSKAIIARFEAERNALALMNHPNIAKVLDAGTTEQGRPFFAMELVSGIPITEYCDEHKLNIGERLKLFVQVCEAIQHAHQKGIIHRDIKPSNVLVTELDCKPVPKVIDFGVAKALNQSLSDRSIYTTFQSVIGTPLYMSPEQASLSAVDVDTRSDVYSLGVLLYELLTGTTPFERHKLEMAAQHEMLRVIREEEPPRPSYRISTLGETAARISQLRQTHPDRLGRIVKGDLDWIVMTALEKERGRRYESASRFAGDVQRYLRNEAIEARPPSAWYLAKKLAAKHRGAFISLSIIFALLSAGIVISSWFAKRAIDAERTARSEAESARDEKREKEVVLRSFADELKLNALDAVLAVKKDADKLIDDAVAAGVPRETIRWLRALHLCNQGAPFDAVQVLEKTAGESGKMEIAAQATLATAYIESGQLNQLLIELVELKDQDPTTTEDRIMLGNVLLWVDEKASVDLLRQAVEERDTPVVRAMCARAMAVCGLIHGDARLVDEAVESITVAEIMAPTLSLVNDSSVLVHHVAMLHCDAGERDKHRDRALRAAVWPDRTSFGELVRGYFYLSIGNHQLARASFVGAAEKGDMPAYHLGPFLFHTSPDTALEAFSKTNFRDASGSGALGARALLLALTPGHQSEAIALSEEICAKFRDFDTRVDALCASLLAGEAWSDVEARAQLLKPSCLGPFFEFEETFDMIAGEVDVDEFAQRVESIPNNGYAVYAVAAKLLAQGRRADAESYFRKCAANRNFLSSYPWYAHAILKRLEADSSWPQWLPVD